MNFKKEKTQTEVNIKEDRKKNKKKKQKKKQKQNKRKKIEQKKYKKINLVLPNPFLKLWSPSLFSEKLFGDLYSQNSLLP